MNIHNVAETKLSKQNEKFHNISGIKYPPFLKCCDCLGLLFMESPLQIFPNKESIGWLNLDDDAK